MTTIGEHKNNIAAHQPNLAVADTTVRFVQRQSPLAEALDLTPDQRDAAFQGIEHVELVTSLAVFGNRLLVRIVARFG